MSADNARKLRLIMGHAEKAETSLDGVLEMMRLMIKDGLGAMAYGQFGGSFPDPTSKTVINGNPDPAAPLWARDNVAETDLKAIIDGINAALSSMELVDSLRRKYTSANMDIRNRLDPTDFCAIHFALHLYEGHRRVKGNLCKICAGFYDEHKREPTGTEADYFHRHGRWPHRPIDPKERRPA